MSQSSKAIAVSSDPSSPIQLQRFSKELSFTVVPDIPAFLYLRRMTVSVCVPNGKRTKLTFYVFYNYRGTVRGTVLAAQRHLAKRALRKEYPAIQFYR